MSSKALRRTPEDGGCLEDVQGGPWWPPLRKTLAVLAPGLGDGSELPLGLHDGVADIQMLVYPGELRDTPDGCV